MSDDPTDERVKAQMARAVFVGGVWYRYDEHNRLVPWPILKLDRLAREAIKRC